jgi:hypothetical protein
MVTFIQAAMVTALVGSFYWIHAAAKIVVAQVGVAGTLLACAVVYVASLMMDRR